MEFDAELFDDEIELLEDDIPEMDFDMPEFELGGFDIDEAPKSSAIKTQTINIKKYPRPTVVKYERAADLAKNMPDLQENESVYSIVSGNFIFGDFIEALMVEKNYYAEELIIATLSLSQDNVDSLQNLLVGGYIKKMSLVVSDFWYAHERRKEVGVPYIIKKLGCDKFEMAAAAIHTKITLIKTQCGKFLVMHGSANLRSSRNVEQFVVENNEMLYNFNKDWINSILDNFSITKKSIRGDKLWQILPEHHQNPQA